MHSSVGAIIKQNDKILMVDRINVPLGWACPAGHIENGETSDQAVIREVKEETNLTIRKYNLLIHEFVESNTCKRGFTGHDWHVYEIIDWRGEVKLSPEHKAIGWKTIEDIKQLRLEKVWQYFFKKLNII